MSYLNPMPVNVCIETPAESVIQEITFDGQEIYQPPVSMSENLTKLAQKIDFTKNIADDQSDDKQESTTATTCNLPWEGIATKFRNCVTEIAALIDILNITRLKNYMVFDPESHEHPEIKQFAVMYSHKKGLSQAGNVLTNAVERLKTMQIETSGRSVADFHVELLQLRQHWRLRKVSDKIIGDLSYKTAGSNFSANGQFLVSKIEDCHSTRSCHKSSFNTKVKQSALLIDIPAELEGTASVMIKCQKDDEKIFNTSFDFLKSFVTSSNSDTSWHKKLEVAQNVLFCKELFNQLAKEAVQLQAAIPHAVIGNKIIATIFPGAQLVIVLCLSSTQDDKKEIDLDKNASLKNYNHDSVLEHSLHQLLREMHYKNTHYPLLHPSSAPLSFNKRRYLGGPGAADRYELLQYGKSTTLLEQVIEQAQHSYLRNQTEEVLDGISKQVKDPIIISHWNSLNSPTQSSVNVRLVSMGFDYNCKTSLLIQVHTKSLKCICKGGQVVILSYESQEIQDFLMCQVYQHQMTGIHHLSKSMGWQILSSTHYLGTGTVEPLGNASSCILASPLGDRLIAIRCNPQGEVNVSIAHSPRKDFYSGQLVKERKWENLGGPFKEVRWDKMEGKNFLNKIELLMASLTSSS